MQGRSVSSAITSLKAIVTIVAGLTVTNGIISLVTGGAYAQIRLLNEFEIVTIAIFLLLVANVVRFYHGNIRHIDNAYSIDSYRSVNTDDVKKTERSNLGLDFLVVFVECVVLAITSFYINSLKEFFSLFIGLLIFDVLWTIGSYAYTPNRPVFVHQKRWTLNNVVAVILLLVASAYSHCMNTTTYHIIFPLILGCNTVADFSISWKFYFPRYHEAKAQEPSGRGKHGEVSGN
jgi:hypothetical protein